MLQIRRSPQIFFLFVCERAEKYGDLHDHEFHAKLMRGQEDSYALQRVPYRVLIIRLVALLAGKRSATGGLMWGRTHCVRGCGSDGSKVMRLRGHEGRQAQPAKMRHEQSVDVDCGEEEAQRKLSRTSIAKRHHRTKFALGECSRSRMSALLTNSELRTEGVSMRDTRRRRRRKVQATDSSPQALDPAEQQSR